MERPGLYDREIAGEDTGLHLARMTHHGLRAS